jgi:outer membrane protein assembly factor BamB
MTFRQKNGRLKLRLYLAAHIFAMKPILTLLILLAFSATLPAADWPSFQGPNRDNTTPETGWRKDWPADGPPILWKLNVGRGLTSFAVVVGKVFTAGNDGADKDSIVCLDLESGRELWRHTYACLTAAHPMSIVPFGPAGTPCVSEGRVFTLSREGDLLCLDAEKGKVIWKKNLVNDLKGKRPVYGYGSSVLAEPGRVFVDAGGADGSTVCLDAKTGDVIWAKGSGEAGYATPVLAKLGDANTLIVFKGEALTVINPETGTELARHETTTRDFCNCATPAVRGSTVFISHTGDDGSTALDWKSGKLTTAWNERTLGMLFNSGVPWKQSLIVFNDQVRGSKDLRCLDMATGKSLWVCTEIDKGTAIYSDDHLFVLTSTGELVLAKPLPDKLDILSRAQVLSGKTYILPVLSNGRLLCKNNMGDVVCLDLKASK